MTISRPAFTVDFFRTSKPKLIIPVVEATESALIKAAESIRHTPADMVEWRVDRFEFCHDTERVKTMSARLHEILEVPLLFTIRTSHEGGDWKPSSEQYRDLIADVCAAKATDFVDVQYLNPEARRCFRAAKSYGIPVVASHHDCKATENAVALADRLDAMAAMGADVCKLAVMPRTPGDVLALLTATHTWTQRSSIPLISMSMGSLGVISRVTGQLFGSCATFGALGNAISAPGQLPLDELIAVMDILGRDLDA